MKKITVFILVMLLAFGIIAPSAYCQDAEQTSYKSSGKGDAILFDLFFLRPLSIISCGIGLGAVLVGAPFIVGRDNAREVGDALLNETGNFAVVRPLGQIN